jgi:malate/lactate dehydrogenase
MSNTINWVCHLYLHTKIVYVTSIAENESISKWTQVNAALVGNIVSQVCIHSPHATLIICTQPNELMTYVASCVSKFPNGRVLGLGASVDTAYAHRTILDQTESMHGHVKGFFVLGHGRINDSCTTLLTNNLTINGIHCLDVHSKLLTSQIKYKTMKHQFVSRKRKAKDWDIVKTLNNNEHIYSNVTRRLPIITDLIARQKTVTKYFLSNSTIPHAESKPQESIRHTFPTKSRSNWVEAMLIVHIIHALINGSEFQSNFAVNVAPIANSKDVFINYPTILGSSNRGVEYMLPFHHAQTILKHPSFLIPYEKLQTKIDLSKSNN